MLAVRTWHAPTCAACRLHASIAAKQMARSRKGYIGGVLGRAFASKNRQRKQEQHQQGNSRSAKAEDVEIRGLLSKLDEEAKKFGLDLARLSAGIVSTEVSATHTMVSSRVQKEGEQSVEEKVLRVREEFGGELPQGYLTEEEYKVYERLYGKPLPPARDVGRILGEGIENILNYEHGRTTVLRERGDGLLEEVGFAVDDEEVEDLEHEDGGVRINAGDAMLESDIQLSLSSSVMPKEELEAGEAEEQDDNDPTQRTHPLTLANRFGTFPSALQLSRDTFVDPVTLLLSGMPNVHLTEAAHRTFGGVGLPYSTSTPQRAKTMQQKPIALDTQQGSMSEMEADMFMAVLMPAVLASVTGVLVETRKRLGTAWAEKMVSKAEAGELKILDAGGAGAGIHAVREMLKAEWKRMHEEDLAPESALSLAEADGKLGGAGMNPPLGSATVLTGSDTLRKRASQILDNTTFLPRLPDYLHTSDVAAKQKGKFDIIIAAHTLWPLKEDYIRKSHTQNLWNMLHADGGVLLLLEKGIARGFELIAGAREMLLDNRITSADGSAKPNTDIYSTDADLDRPKEQGMIIAPCTNHSGCPMYLPKGILKGRKDVCHFEQRFIRPEYLQRILGARDKNFEDVKFSYLAVMRGRDLRSASTAATVAHEGAQVRQGEKATIRAFDGYGNHGDSNEQVPNSLSLPRAILPPLKRKGHVILDLCTPTGTLERWTVPRSYGKQAFRDARKSGWGDLWPLGAKTRVLRTVQTPKDRGKRTDDVTVKAKTGKSDGFGVDEYGRLVSGGGMGGEGGNVRVRKGNGKDRRGSVEKKAKAKTKIDRSDDHGSFGGGSWATVAGNEDDG